MNAGVRTVASPTGPLSLRPETPADAPFLAALFASRAAPMLRMAGLPEPQVEQLVALQHRAQTASYRAAFPDARFLIVEQGSPVGRLVEHDEPGGAYVVDIALLPQRQGQGLGSALVRELQARQAALGLGVRARVAAGNGASRAMFRKLGFVESGADQAGDLTLTWRPERV